MWPYSWTHVGTPSHLGHMDRVAATMPSQAHAGAAQEAPNIGQWEGQDVPLVRPSSCTVKGGIPSSRRYLPTYLHPRRYSFCNNLPQMSGDRVIIWSFGNLIACTVTMGSKHTSFPKLKSQTPLKVCPWKRPLARSFLRGKNSIRGGTHFAIIPFKRPEIQ